MQTLNFHKRVLNSNIHLSVRKDIEILMCIILKNFYLYILIVLGSFIMILSLIFLSLLHL